MRNLLLAANKSSKPSIVIPDDLTLLGRELLEGDILQGFYGEFEPSQVILPSALRSAMGLSSGTAQVNIDLIPWLGFANEGKKLLIAKRSPVHSINWNVLNSAGVVDGSKTITIEGKLYKVRLMTGGISSSDDSSEWNRLILKVAGSASASISKWATYSNADLNIVSGNGRAVITNTLSPTNSGYIARRGISSAADHDFSAKNYTSGPAGWRPVLELIE